MRLGAELEIFDVVNGGRRHEVAHDFFAISVGRDFFVASGCQPTAKG